MTFLCEYKFKNAFYSFTIKADDWPDAEERSAVLNSRILGEVKMALPGWLPAANKLVALYCTIRNALVKRKNDSIVLEARNLLQ